MPPDRPSRHYHREQNRQTAPAHYDRSNVGRRDQTKERSSAVKTTPQLLPGWKNPSIPMNPDKLPPLLEIRTDTIARLATRHRSVHTNDFSSSLTPRWDHELDSYEGLETTGDAYLASMVNRILRNRISVYPMVSS
jgi:hypothetical protein